MDCARVYANACVQKEMKKKNEHECSLFVFINARLKNMRQAKGENHTPKKRDLLNKRIKKSTE